jgi:hypothetical protein
VCCVLCGVCYVVCAVWCVLLLLRVLLFDSSAAPPTALVLVMNEIWIDGMESKLVVFFLSSLYSFSEDVWWGWTMCPVQTTTITTTKVM